MWLAIHDGDPVPDGIAKASQTELSEVLVRALSEHLQTVTNVDSANVIERLSKFNVEVSIEVEGKRTAAKSTKQFYSLMTHEQLRKPHQICVRVGGFEYCRPLFLTHLP